MRTTTITDAKNGLSALIDRVRAGESVLILDRGTPVARLEPVVTASDPTGRIQRLERAGLIGPARQAPPLDLIRSAAPELAPGASAVQAVLDERLGDR
jgi:prevent-host-death family protein